MQKEIIWLWAYLATEKNNLKLLKLTQTVDIRQLYAMDISEIINLVGRDSRLASSLADKDLKKAYNEFGICKQNDIDILTIDDDKYPSLLKEIYNPPCILFSKGNYKCLNSNVIVTMVGTRKSTAYGEMHASKIACGLSISGVTIATGIAGGIDSAVLNSVIKNDGKLICVLPNGILEAKNSHRYELEKILKNGVIISEHLPNEKTPKAAYQRRNRILSGVAHGTFVVEAPASSGALITANYAQEQNRDVFALVANADSISSKGAVDLIKEGAFAVSEFLDIYSHYDRLLDKKEEINFDFENFVMKKVEKKSKISSKIYNTLNNNQKLIVDILSDREMTVDEIIPLTKLGVSEILVILSYLEIEQIIMSCPGGKYKIVTD